jgi:hypothetical protein
MDAKLITVTRDRVDENAVGVVDNPWGVRSLSPHALGRCGATKLSR